MSTEEKVDLDKLDLSLYSLDELVALYLKLLRKMEREAYGEIKKIKLKQEREQLVRLRGSLSPTQ